MTTGFSILAGLPPYGPEVESFPPGQLLAREGLVVRFDISPRQQWVVNFKRGIYDHGDKVIPHPDGERLVVYAGGNVFYVDPAKQSITEGPIDCVNHIAIAPDHSLIVLGGFDQFTAIDAKGVRWETPQIAWDGFRNIELTEKTLTGEAYSPVDDTWHPFEIDLRTGACTGSVYAEQLGRFIPIVKKD